MYYSILLTALLLGLAAPTIRAQPVLYVNAAATGAGDGSSWADAFPLLQDALAAAQAGDEIWVAAGTYHPDQGIGITPGDREASFVMKNDVALYGGFAGTETMRGERDFEANRTVLSGDLLGNDNDNVVYDEPTRGDNSHHIVFAEGVFSTAVVDGFTITAGNANETGPAGGGIWSTESSLIVANIVLRANTAQQDGAGMWIVQGQLELNNVAFERNKAGLGEIGSVFTGRGGGLYTWFGSLTLKEVVFLDNEAGDGGGFYNNRGDLFLAHTLFIGNTAVEGAGLLDRGPNRSMLINVRFLGNYALGSGGGLITYKGTTHLANILFSGNHADFYGGGIYNLEANEVILTSAVFSGNTATIDGAAIYNDASPLTVVNSVFWGNTVSEGGDQFFVRDTLMPHVARSLIEGGLPEGVEDGGNNLGANPLFVDPSGVDNLPGTEDDDLRLMPGSPAIDAGDNTAVLADSLDLDEDGDIGEPIPIDLDGNVRRYNGGSGTATVDLGPYEFGAPPISIHTEIPHATGPVGILLSAPYPNPFYGATHLTLRLSRPTQVSVVLYDVLGRQVLQPFGGVAHESLPIYIDGTSLPGGVYVVQVTGHGVRATRTVVHIGE